MKKNQVIRKAFPALKLLGTESDLRSKLKDYIIDDVLLIMENLIDSIKRGK